MNNNDILGAMSAPGPKIDPTKFPRITCDKCGHYVWRSGVIMYNIPGVVIGNGTEDVPYPVPVYTCDKCGEVIKFVRDELEKIESDKEKNDKNSGSTLII